jgi:hypothetical protein
VTLSDYIDLTCAKLHRTDDASRREARKYIQSRYQMIYEGCPWRDVCAAMVVPLATEQVTILPYLIDRVISVRWSNNFSLRNEQLWTVIQVDPNRFDQVGDPISFSIYSPSAVAVSPSGHKLAMGTSTATSPFTISVYGAYQNQDREETISVANNSTIYLSATPYDEVYSLSKSVNNADLAVSREDSGAQLLYLRTFEKERTHQRLHFHSTPQNARSGLLLYKKSFKPLINDSDAPEIKGIDNALLSAAISDMLAGQRQYSKAQAQMSESVAMIAVMQDLERHQSANLVRIIPDPEPDPVGFSNTSSAKDHFVP